MKTMQVENEYRETELGLLPKEWDIVRFDDVAKYINGYPFKPSEWKTEGVPIIRIQNLTKSTDKINHYDGQIDDKYKVKSGDLLISWSASLGVFIWDRKDGWLNQHIFKVTDYSPKIDKNYFYYIVGTRINFMKEKTHGSTMHHITKKEFEAVEIQLPPLPEQQNIAYVLSTAQEAQQATEQVINSLKELKQSLMKHLFTYGAVSFEDAGKIKLHKTDIGEIPEGWSAVNLGQIAKLQGQVSVNSDNFVSFEHIESGSGKILSVDSAKKYRTKTPFSKYTLLYGKIRPYLNKVWLANIDGFCTHDIVRIVPTKCDIVFLKYILLSKKFVQFATSKSTGTKMPRVKWTSMETYNIALPQLAEQQQIASILSSVEEKIDAEERKKMALLELFNSLLKNLMTAKIRVKDLIVEVKHG